MAVRQFSEQVNDEPTDQGALPAVLNMRLAPLSVKQLIVGRDPIAR